MFQVPGAVLALLVAVTAASASGHAFKEPGQVLAALYGAYVAGIEIRDFSPYFSDRLTKAMNGRTIGQSELAALELEPIVGASPWQIAGLRLDVGESDAASAEVIASFTNFGKPVSLSFDLVWEPVDGWQIDHIAGRSGELAWCTNTIVDLAHELSGRHGASSSAQVSRR